MGMMGHLCIAEIFLNVSHFVAFCRIFLVIVKLGGQQPLLRVAARS